jgi:hypothetical protein
MLNVCVSDGVENVCEVAAERMTRLKYPTLELMSTD